MRIGDIFRLRMRSLLSRTHVEQELDEELRYHLDRQTDAFMASGMNRHDAHKAALRAVGGVEQRKEECRDARGLNMIDNFRSDVRFALRQLRRSPAFTFTAIVILGLGITANVAVFGLVDAALIAPLPYREPSKLVAVYETAELIPRSNLSYQDFLDWKRQNQVFQNFDVYGYTGLMLSTPDGGKLVRGVRVSDGFFRTLGVAPAMGRDFRPGEDIPNGPRAAILSYGGWQSRFGGRKDIVGQTITLNGASVEIAGVMPADFHFGPAEPAEMWVTFQGSNGCDVQRGCHSVYGVARLKEGVTVAAAEASMKMIAKRLEAQYPDSNRGQGAAVIPLSEAIVGDVRPIFLMLMAGAALLVAIASVNVASLLLVRSDSRKREFAVRSALGASAGRLVRQFVTEGGILVVCGSLAGLLAGSWAMQLLVRLVPADMLKSMPYLRNVGLNGRTLLLAAGIAFLSVLLFAATPALRLSLAQIRSGLAESGRGSAGLTWRRLGSRLVVVELAIAMVLLVSAGLLSKSLQRLLQVELGFRPDHLAAIEVGAPLLEKEPDVKKVAFSREVIRRVAELPGVESVALASRLPLQGNGNTTWIRFEGRPYNGEHNEVNQRDVSPKYFATMRAKLLRGRYLTEADDASKPRVAVINQKLADQYFAGEDPIGKRIGNTSLDPESLTEIVGIVDNIREASLEDEIWPAVYYSINQETDTFFHVIARTSQREEALLQSMSTTIRQISNDVVTVPGTSMEDRIMLSEPAYLKRSSAWLVGSFAGIALLMSVVGLYGVVAYSVSQRTREIGVRMALGAERSSVCGLVLKEAVMLTAVGTALGIALSVGGASVIREMLFGVEPWDVPTLAVVATGLSAAAVLASYVPARRAASVNPVEALRSE